MPKTIPKDPKMEKIEIYAELEVEKMDGEQAKKKLAEIVQFFRTEDWGPRLFYCRFKAGWKQYLKPDSSAKSDLYIPLVFERFFEF